MSSSSTADLLVRTGELVGPAICVPGTRPRLALPDANGPDWGLRSEVELGFFGRHEPSGLIDELGDAGLRGRGGAGFATHMKWRAVANAPGEKVVVANGHEGEPASAKDRWLLLHRPHLVLEGLILAARAVRARRGVVYVSRSDTAVAATNAIADLRAARLLPADLRLDVHQVEHRYVAGEETAVCRAINGGPALPTAKPPRPFERGVDDLPTLIDNVETLAHVAWIARFGASAFRTQGTAGSPGTALFTLNGCPRPGVYEAALGTSVGELFHAAGGLPDGMGGLLMGGWFGGILRGDHSALRCCYDAVRETGSSLGCASLTALGRDADLLATAAELGQWFEHESARQCGSCRNGTAAMSRALLSVAAGDRDPAHVANLSRWGTSFVGTGACAFINGAAALARSVAAELNSGPTAISNRWEKGSSNAGTH
jgi:NADH:ubiquinone oxidoreductase subunit F (NADH-binding)